MVVQSVPSALRSVADRVANAPAILAPGCPPLTYRALWRQCEDIGGALRRFGVGRNDPVAVVVPNGPQAAVAALGVAAAATCMPLNPAYRAPEFDFFLSDAGVKALVLPASADSPARDVARARGIAVIELWPERAAAAGLFSLRADRHTELPVGEPASPSDTALVLYTSGTTSRPKRVELTHRNIFASAASIQRTLALGHDDRCLNVMPLFHVHGLVGALFSSLVSGASVVCTPGFQAPEFLGWIEEFAATWYTAVPTMHQSILAQAARRGVPSASRLRFIRSASAPLPQKVMAGLEDLFHVPVIESYGMTEAAHQIASNPLPPGVRKPGSVGKATGLEVTVIDEFGNAMPSGEAGEIAIRGESVADRLNGWFKTGDLGHLDEDGYLFVDGRLKEVINRGGEKVWPREVDEVLASHPAVEQAVTFAVPDSRLGEDVGAAVVVKAQTSIAARDIVKFAAARLADFKVPRHVVFVDKLPQGPTGKVQRAGLAVRLGVLEPSALAATRPHVEPRSPLEATLIVLWEELLRRGPIGVEDDFLELGGDSLLASLLLTRVREKLRVEIQMFAFFEAPTVAGLAAAIEQARLSPVSRSDAGLSIPRSARAEHENVPLSFSQQSLWFLHKWEPQSPAYHRPVLYELMGPLDREALEKAVNEIVRRHEILRTTFPSLPDSPVQQIAAWRPVPLSFVSLTTRPAPQRQDAVRPQLQDEFQRPFDLENGPLFRVRLFAMDRERHLLLLVFHHIVFDGWSATVLFRELTALYAAFRAGSQSPLPKLPIQYADFARWQRGQLGDVLDKALAFWEHQLRDSPPLLELPTDRARPPVQTFRGGRASLHLGRELATRVKALARSESATQFMTLLAAFKALLHRYSGQSDIVVGSPVAGRAAGATEMLVGCFVNTVVFRTHLDGEASFRELLRHVRRVAIDAYSHAEIPFEKLVETLAPKRLPDRTPLFQVMFQVRSALEEADDIAGLTIKELRFDADVAKLDLTLEVVESPDGLTCVAVYNHELFDASTVQRLLTHYQALIEAVTDNPDQRLSQVSLLSPIERHQLLVEWNDTACPLPGESVQQLFEAVVERTPAALAATESGRAFTYAELNQRANQLAHYLRGLNVARGTRVGISIDRSPDMLVALLAILKAGGAYVPLDPTSPRDRLEFMVAESQAPLVVTDARLESAMRVAGVRIVCVDRDWPTIATCPDAAPIERSSLDDPACVMYTSGSTGQPKGVEVLHRGIIRLVFGLDDVRLDATARLLHMSPLAFDASTFEIWGPLLHGGRVVLMRDALPSFEQLERVLADEQVNCAWLTASLFNAIVDERPQALSGLRQLVIGGEALSPAHVARALDALADTQIINGYGPTEGTTFTCSYAIPRDLDRRTRSIPIGRPIANTRVFVLDRHLQPVPIGVPGELCVDGDGVARGYLNRPDLTAESFIPHPFTDDSSARLYRTGDRVRYLPDGTLEFLGRFDEQVKIRGFRIEPGEIEAALSRHPQVRQSVVFAREEAASERYLVACVVPAAAAAPRHAELRAFLEKTLPPYMIPRFFIDLDRIPLTAAGKVDRAALSSLPPQSMDEYEPREPRNATERKLAAMWADLFEIERVSPDDHFFDLGGHSLMAVRLASRVSREFAISLTPRHIFETPTIAGLAELIDVAARDVPMFPVHQEIVPPDGGRPLSFAQERIWFLDQLEPSSSVYNITQALRLIGPLDEEALREAVREIVRRHEVLRTRFVAIDGRPVQVLMTSAAIEVPVVDLTGRSALVREAEVSERVLMERRRPFDLARDPAVRVELLRLTPDEHVLIVIFHHIASDAWSTEIFHRELGALYNAFTRAQPSPLPTLAIQYADVAEWQREQLRGERLELQLAYWKERLADPLPTCELACDRPRPVERDSRGARESIEVPEPLTASLRALSRSEGATLFMLLLAAFKVVLGRLTDQDDIVVGSPSAGRTQVEAEPLIGLFIDTLVLRTDVSGNPSFRALLHRVRNVALGAYAHAELPFERLVATLNPRRDLRRHPIFGILVNFVRVDRGTLALDGIRVETLEYGEPQSKFPITLYIFDEDERLRVDLVYQRALYSPDRMVSLVLQFRHLLEQVVEAPDTPIQSYSLATPESDRLLPNPADPLNGPRYEPVMQLFAAWTAVAPDSPAIRQGEQSWSYAQLAARVSRLERLLRGVDVKRGDIVAVTGAPSFDLMASLLAVLSSGAVLLTLDRRLPTARQELMLQESGASLLVTVGSRTGDDRFEALRSLRRFDVDEQTDLPVDNEPTPAPVDSAVIAPGDPAYVFFTSGSAGVPKGVLGSHKGLSHFVTWQRETFGVGPSDRCAQLTPLSFDVVLRDVFLPLTGGATLCLPSAADQASSENVIQWLDDEQITVLHAVPSVVQFWLNRMTSGVELRALRWLFLAGEPLTDVLVSRWRAAFKLSGSIVNLYGPTETTLAKAFYVVPADPPPGVQPVGSPLPHTQTLVLNSNGSLCGVGEPGEIVIRTPFRTKGYLNADERQRRRFVVNPFCNDPDDLLYYTGDRGRYRPDGLLEILGRVDDQVKIRGVRIEPSEVMATLARHPSVSACVVMASDTGGPDRSLVAYVVAAAPSATAKDLRAYLASQLPAALVPNTFVFLNAFPLLANGKVDRSALPKPVKGAAEVMAVVPHGLEEETLAAIWRDVLNFTEVGRNDDFFDLGGHSLQVTQVQSRVRQAFGLELPLSAFFEAPTLAELAAVVVERTQAARSA